MKYIPIHFEEYLRSQATENPKEIAMEIWQENDQLRIKIGNLDYIDFGGAGHFFPLDSKGEKLHPMGEDDYERLEECDRMRMRRTQM